MLNSLKINSIKYPYTSNSRMDSRLMICLQYSKLTLSPVSTQHVQETLNRFQQIGQSVMKKNDYIFSLQAQTRHDDVIKWKHFPRNWPFVWGIHRSLVNSPHKGQWRGALMFSLICVWINGWVNNHEAGDLRRYRGHYDVIVMKWLNLVVNQIFE